MNGQKKKKKKKLATAFLICNMQATFDKATTAQHFYWQADSTAEQDYNVLSN